MKRPFFKAKQLLKYWFHQILSIHAEVENAPSEQSQTLKALFDLSQESTRNARIFFIRYKASIRSSLLRREMSVHFIVLARFKYAMFTSSVGFFSSTDSVASPAISSSSSILPDIALRIFGARPWMLRRPA